MAACGQSTGTRTKPGKSEPQRPDEKPLSRNTVVKADTARLIVSDHWRRRAKLEAVSVDRGDARKEIARGSAVFRLKGLRVEANEIEVKWLADHDNFLLSARGVALFHQERKAAYHSTDLSAVVMANDEVTFFQQ